jgi:hypothetical protein
MLRTMFKHGRCLAIATTLAAFVAGAGGCGPEAPVKPAESADLSDASERAKIDQSGKLIRQANDAVAEKKYSEARDLLAKATKLGVESHRFEIGETLEKVDKREAKLWANDVGEVLGEKNCVSAFKDLAEPIAEIDSETFTKELRKLVGTQAIKCAQRIVDAATTAGRFADARKFASAENTTTILGPVASKKLLAEVDASITDALAAQLEEDLNAKRWTEALAKLDEMAKSGNASKEQTDVLLAKIHAGAAPEIASRLQRAIGQKGASETLEQIDGLIKSMHWETAAAEEGEASKGKALPSNLATLREALAIWVETQRLAMKPLKKPEKRWTHGKIAVLPAAKVDAPSRRDIPPSTVVWILGQTKDRALVTDADPTGLSLTAQLVKVTGWVPVNRLAKGATLDWLPPDEQLKGERVWAPLRAPDPLLELGTVTEIKGNDVMVKRVADDAVIKVARASLRTGRLAPGTKVLAFCTRKDQLATIEEVLVGGRSVRLKCDGGALKEELVPALRTKPEFLPQPK